MDTLRTRPIRTPIGTMLAGAVADALAMLEFTDDDGARVAAATDRLGVRCEPGDAPVLDQLESELAAYFAGALRAFTIPLAPRGTPFQLQVWEALRAVEHGQTRSYLDLARAIGRPTATRAVAGANGDNAIAILIPCHRIIGADGSLTGYGGKLWRKQALLELEGAIGHADNDASLFAAPRR